MISTITAIGLFQSLGMLHLLIFFQLPGSCHGVCARIWENGNKITLQAYENGVPLNSSMLNISVNGQSAHFETNNTGFVKFYAPLGIGANRIRISSKGLSSNYTVYYYGPLASIALVPLGVIVLLAIAKISDFKTLNKRILAYFNSEDYQNPKDAHSACGTGHLESNNAHPTLKYDGNEPCINEVAKFMLKEAASSGSYKIGRSAKASRFINENSVLTYYGIGKASFRLMSHAEIAALNIYEYNMAQGLKHCNSKEGHVLLYMHALGILKVVKCSD
ncbi:MAG: hypothetical protein QXW10_00105 [Candidatus Micrarchaeaceae archaeon]